MDALTLIVTALTTGATLALKAALGEAAKDAYKNLKQRIVERYGDKGDVVSTLERLEKKPESEGRRITLKEELAETGADADEELLQEAQRLLREADPEGAEAGRYEVTASDHSVAVGRDAKGPITITHTA